MRAPTVKSVPMMFTMLTGTVHDVAPKYGLAAVPAPLPPTQDGNAFGLVPVFGVGSNTQPTDPRMFPEFCAPPAACVTSTSELTVSLLPKSSWLVNAYVQTTGSPTSTGDEQFFPAPAPVSAAPALPAPTVSSAIAAAATTTSPACCTRRCLKTLIPAPLFDLQNEVREAHGLPPLAVLLVSVRYPFFRSTDAPVLPPSDVTKLNVMSAGTGAIVPDSDLVWYLIEMMYVPGVGMVYVAFPSFGPTTVPTDLFAQSADQS